MNHNLNQKVALNLLSVNIIPKNAKWIEIKDNHLVFNIGIVRGLDNQLYICALHLHFTEDTLQLLKLNEVKQPPEQYQSIGINILDKSKPVLIVYIKTPIMFGQNPGEIIQLFHNSICEVWYTTNNISNIIVE